LFALLLLVGFGISEIDHSSFSQVKIKARYTRKSDNIFNSTPLAILSATMRLRNDFRLLPLDILVTRECMIKHFSSSHNTAKQGRFLSHMEHQFFDQNLKLAEVFTL
jgi:hypothetical protein